MATNVRIIPVLDVRQGVVVHGVAGQRADYRPIKSVLTPSTAPREVAHAFRTHLGVTELYLADLDALAGQPPAVDLYRSLHADGARLLVDAGLRRARDVDALMTVDNLAIVAALETLDSPAALRQMVHALGERLLFSLDLKEGVPLSGTNAWGVDPWTIVQKVLDLGVRRLILLDLSRVGVGQGTGTEELCRRLSRTATGVEVIAGGGVRDKTDLEVLAHAGVHAVLLASALHNGRITRQDIRY